LSRQPLVATLIAEQVRIAPTSLSCALARHVASAVFGALPDA